MYITYFIRTICSKRPESYQLRNYLIKKYKVDNFGYHCSMCLKKYPLSLLDTSHLKPRCTLELHELKETNNIEFMCKMCHNLYDLGKISINEKSIIVAKEEILKYQHLYVIQNIGMVYSKINDNNLKYLLWHYTNIYQKNIHIF